MNLLPPPPLPDFLARQLPFRRGMYTLRTGERLHVVDQGDPGSRPVLMVHGRADDTCPPRWATATQRALVRAGVDSRIEWYDDGHAFGPAFNAAMDRTIRFFEQHLR